MSQFTKINKNTAIETLRGLAIILMVSGHVIGAKNTDGLKVADNSVWRFFYYAFEYIRMPLFTIISGYIYAYKPVAKCSSNSKFVFGKVNRLLIPLVVVSTLFYLIQHFMPGTNFKSSLSDIQFIYFYPYAHFWFLQGMMVVFLLIVVIENLKLLNTLRSSLVCLAIFALVFVLLPYKFNNFSANKVPFLLTFFTIGVILKRFSESIFRPRLLWAAGFILATMFIYQLSLFDSSDNKRLNNFIALCVGSSACILLIKLGWQNKQLTWLGGFSFGIYLFHILGSVASRVLMSKLHVHNTFVQILSGVTVGVAFPVILQLTVGRIKIFAVTLFGEKINYNKALLSPKENDLIIHQKPASGNAVI